MSAASEADQFLLNAIRHGDADAWSQLVKRHQGRLVAFAVSRAPHGADAEDLVQDTFIAFLRGLDRFRGDASIETYLFTILRRKIIDRLRASRSDTCSLNDLAFGELKSSEPAASWYSRQDEDATRMKDALLLALRNQIEGYKTSLRFEDLKIIEMIFAFGKRNKDIAEAQNVTEQRVSLMKHRVIARLRKEILSQLGTAEGQKVKNENDVALPPSLKDDVLRELWRDYRISCLKRTTIGGYLLGTLEETWHEYVEFHLGTGCAFCLANLDDLQRQTQTADHQALRQRVMNSTVGFLRSIETR